MSGKKTGERGQVLVLAALFMVVLLLTAALAIDYSSWLVARRDYQGIADAASLAGAAQLPPPGVAVGTSANRENAAVEAMVYLSDHLGWGIDRTTAKTNVGNFLNKQAPYVPAGSGFCVWIWTPVPASGIATTTGAQCEPKSTTLYSPPTFAGDGRKVFVRVQSLRPSFFAGVAGINNTLVSAIAVAGGVRSDYGVITLKPRLGSPDNQLGLTINGNTTKLIVPVGNVGSNYSATCSSTSAVGMITFKNPSLDQTVDLQEPGVTTCSSTNVLGGSIQQLLDPIPDPDYFSPRPAWCSGAFTSQCQQGSGGNWPYASSTPFIFPPCANATDISKNQITNCSSGEFTVYPGKYEYIEVPLGATARLSPNCFGDAQDQLVDSTHTTPDANCISNGRAGVYYFNAAAGTAGINVKNGGKLYGCGVLTVFDPREVGGTGRTQFQAAGSDAVVGLNDPSIPGGCSMKYDPGNLSGTTNFAWYGYNQAYENPVTMWVRPNRDGYTMTGSNNGSNVISFTSNATINESGAIYAPEDNTEISGGPSGSGVGQIVAWTITYSGGTDINETYQGPATIRARLWQ